MARGEINRLEGCSLVSLLCCNTIAAMTERKLGRKRFIWLTLLCYSPSLKEVRTGTQGGQELEAGVDTEGAMEECFLLTCPS